LAISEQIFPALMPNVRRCLADAAGQPEHAVLPAAVALPGAVLRQN